MATGAPRICWRISTFVEGCFVVWWETVSSGPGDFRRPTGLAAAVGDTVFVVDAGNNRLNRVLMNSGRVEVVRFDTPQFTRHSLIVGVLPGERFVLTESWTLPTNLPGTPTNTNRSVVIALRNGTSRKVASLVDLRVSQVETRFRRLDTMTVMTRLAPQAALVIWDTLIITSSGEPPIDKKEVRRIEATTPFSDSLPLFKKLFTTSDGLLWVLESIAPGDKNWTAIAIRRDGTIVGRLSGSSAACQMAFGAGRILLRSEDSDGVVTLTVRRIEGSSASR